MISAKKEKERRKRKSEEKRKKAMVALLVFIIATLETVFVVVFSRKTLLDAKGPFGDDVFKNPVRTTRAIMVLGNYHHLRLLY